MHHDTRSDGLEDVVRLLRSGTLLPQRQRSYGPLVGDALARFLDNLPERRREEIAAGQRDLGSSAPVFLRLLALARTSPLLHKLGQVVARDRRLPSELRRVLQRLETMPPSFSPEAVKKLVAEAVPDRGGIQVGEAALAEASVAVVVPYTTPSGERGVLKILKPGIEERLAEDLDACTDIGDFLAAKAEELGLAASGWSETLTEVCELLRTEVDLEAEQRHLAAAGERHRFDSRVEVPRLLPECGPRVTAMSRIEGTSVTAIEDAAARRAAGRIVVDALVVRPLFATGPSVPFHADPHAGNLLWTPQRRLGLIDWALVGRIDQGSLRRTVLLLLAALRLDVDAISRTLGELAVNRPRPEALRAVSWAAVRRLRRGALPGLGWLLRLLDEAVLHGGARYPGDLLLFRKTLLTLQGVVADLAPGHSLTLDLASAGVRRLLAEWPGRLTSGPFSSGFPTHLSNADLAPTAIANFWGQTLRDLVGGPAPAG